MIASISIEIPDVDKDMIINQLELTEEDIARLEKDIEDELIRTDNIESFKVLERLSSPEYSKAIYYNMHRALLKYVMDMSAEFAEKILYEKFENYQHTPEYQETIGKSAMNIFNKFNGEKEIDKCQNQYHY